MTSRERKLVRRLKARDESAFNEMVRTYQNNVFNVVYRMLGNWEEAEDLAQEVFVTVFKAVDTFRGDSKLSTWLYRIAVNHCKNRYKYLSRRKYHATRSLHDVAEHALEKDGQERALGIHAQVHRPDRLAEGHQLERAIQQAVAQMDEDQRALIILRDVQGLSYQEIAHITQLAEGTVKSRLHRARNALKDRLKKFL